MFVCMSSLEAVAKVKYACRLLRLHEKKVPLPTPIALTSTSPVFDGCGFDRERGGEVWRRKPERVASSHSLLLS